MYFAIYSTVNIYVFKQVNAGEPEKLQFQTKKLFPVTVRNILSYGLGNFLGLHVFILRLLLFECLIIVIFYAIFLMQYAVIIKIKRKQGVNNYFKPLILSDFTTVAS